MEPLHNDDYNETFSLPFIGGSVRGKRNLVNIAKLAEQAERYEEMALAMKMLADSGSDMSGEERNLLSSAYKSVIGSRRSAWRSMNESRHMNKFQKRSDPDPQETDKLISSYMLTIEKELRKHCIEILEVVEARLLNMSHSADEAKVCFLKMKADYQRYLCEICKGVERKQRADESMIAYKAALDQAVILLPPTHPLRLGLHLNFSVFYYEIMDQVQRAYRTAKKAFDDAMAELETLSEETYKDSTTIMSLLRDNINLWQSQQAAQELGLT